MKHGKTSHEESVIERKWKLYKKRNVSFMLENVLLDVHKEGDCSANDVSNNNSVDIVDNELNNNSEDSSSII